AGWPPRSSPPYDDYHDVVPDARGTAAVHLSHLVRAGSFGTQRLSAHAAHARAQRSPLRHVLLPARATRGEVLGHLGRGPQRGHLLQRRGGAVSPDAADGRAIAGSGPGADSDREPAITAPRLRAFLEQ